MKLGNTGYSVAFSKDGTWYQIPQGNWVEVHCNRNVDVLRKVVNYYKGHKYDVDESWKLIMIGYFELIVPEDGTADQSEINVDNINSKEETVVQHLIDFFSEFYFEPNFRFVNTLALLNKQDTVDAKQYVENYFELSDSEFLSSIVEKLCSLEFDVLLKDLKEFSPSTKINKRFKLYYGSQGTGKTTEALKEADGLCMICHSAMLPSDLMEDFKFDDGKAGFNPSILWRAMEEGRKICLDEINLLPFESLRFLQSILDGKEEFTYKGVVVKIKEGFQIIGTMNLVVNGSVYSLPEPLIDRAEELKKFKLTASDLSRALV